MASNEKFLNQRQRYQPVTLPQDFSDEEMARDWTLSEADQQEIGKYRKNSRLFIATQLCAVRLYGRFVMDVNDLSPRIINYLSGQLALPVCVGRNSWAFFWFPQCCSIPGCNRLWRSCSVCRLGSARLLRRLLSRSWRWLSPSRSVSAFSHTFTPREKSWVTFIHCDCVNR